MEIIGVPEKVIIKLKKELVELHKRCIKTYLLQRSMSASGRRKFFQLYDCYIDESNIVDYFYIPIDIFCKALVQNNLNQFYIPDYRALLNNQQKKK